MTHCSAHFRLGAALISGGAFSGWAGGFCAGGFLGRRRGVLFARRLPVWPFSALATATGVLRRQRTVPRRIEPLHQPGRAEQDAEGKNRKVTKRRSIVITQHKTAEARRWMQIRGELRRNWLATRICVYPRSSAVPMAFFFLWINARRGAGRRGNCPGRECRRSWRSSSQTDTRRGETAPARLPARRSRRGDCRRGAGRPSRR